MLVNNVLLVYNHSSKYTDNLRLLPKKIQHCTNIAHFVMYTILKTEEIKHII